MVNNLQLKKELDQSGFAIVADIFSDTEITAILETIEAVDCSRPTFRKSADLFAIRQFFKEVPNVVSLIFTKKLKLLINTIFGEGYFVVKSIYFDKPGQSNWFVGYHQDLTVSVDRKVQLSGFGPWSVKENQYAVQPPLDILESNYTIRIHLDETDENNGALRVVPGSHLRGVCRAEFINWSKEVEVSCTVPAGGVMVMRPLLLHASSRTTNEKPRRVVHIEFSNSSLPDPLRWAELLIAQASR